MQQPDAAVSRTEIQWLNWRWSTSRQRSALLWRLFVNSLFLSLLIAYLTFATSLEIFWQLQRTDMLSDNVLISLISRLTFDPQFVFAEQCFEMIDQSWVQNKRRLKLFSLSGSFSVNRRAQLSVTYWASLTDVRLKRVRFHSQWNPVKPSETRWLDE